MADKYNRYRWARWIAKDRPRLRAFIKLTPVLFLAGLMMISNIPVLSEFFGFSLDILIIAPLATILACIVAWLSSGISVNRSITAAIDNVKEMQLVFFILMMAYAMADVFMASGVGASIISLSLRLGLSARTVAIVAFLVSSLLSLATGTSWGTFAATAPIFIWLAHITGGNIHLTMAAVAGGSCFGDNLGLISDNTVVSSGIHRVEITDRLRNQWAWATSCLVLTAICFFIASLSLNNAPVDGSSAIASIPADTWAVLAEERPAAVLLLRQVEVGVPLYMILPILIVITAAFLKVPTLLCLVSGIISAYILGLFAGTITNTSTFLELLKNGFSSAGSWVIIMMAWVGAFGGVMAKMDAFRPLSRLSYKLSRKVSHLMFWNGMMSFLGNAALADEMAQIVTIGPIVRDITEDSVIGPEAEKEKLRFRNATFSSALGIFGSQFIPWHVFVHYFLSVSAMIYPLAEFNFASMVRYNYMAMISVFSLLFLTLTNLDRFLPNFGTPKEPIVSLRAELPEKEDVI
ncbi:MAG: Na+/H+ antiporter NhaC family protein [Eubacteriales bacterium]|nr:Na+/H+ antiporter NhaC family protein [Eubacteriales bacterium]